LTLVGRDRKQLLFGVLLGIAGFAVNLLPLELFFNVDFLFGTFFVFLAILGFGAGPGIAAGVIAGACTWFIWNHPWAVVIFTAEASFVALRERRGAGVGGIVTSDILYWMLVGGPLVWFFYHGVMGIQNGPTLLIALKQAVNGVFNALLAGIAFMALRAGRENESRPLPSYRQLLFLSMTALVLLPALAYAVIDVRREIDEERERIAFQSANVAVVAQGTLWRWITAHHREVATLSRIVGDPGRASISEVQDQVETFKAASSHFKRMGVLDRDAITVAFSPLVDELGHSNLGRDFSDRPYIPILRRTLKPYVPDVVMGRVGRPAPMLSLVAPIVSRGEYRGYCIGVLDVSRFEQMLRSIAGKQALHITLLDRIGQVVATTRPDLRMMAPFPRDPDGIVRPQQEGTYHWIPKPEKGTSIMQRWRRSIVVKELDVDEQLPWKIVVESSMIPTLDKLTRWTTSVFAMLALLSVVISLASGFLSRRLVEPLIRLQQSTRELPSSLNESEALPLPGERIEEIRGLTDNFRQMAGALRENFRNLEKLNETLEDRVAQRTGELAASEARFRSYIENAPDGIFIMDRDGRYIDVNRAGCALAGYSREEILEKRAGEVIVAEDRAQAVQVIDTLFSEGFWSGDFRGIRKDGTRITVASSLVRLSADTFIVFSKDISDRKRIERELIEAKREAEAANGAKSAFLANISHEIRTPMNGILGMTRMLKRTGLDTEQREFLADIERSADHLMLLINDILDLSKIEAGRMEVELAEFRLRDAVSDVLRLQAASAAERGLSLSVEIGEDVPDRVVGDPLRLRQVLSNLLSNAVKFTEAGEVHLRVSGLEMAGAGPLLHFCVSDTGIGIPDEAREKIFAPFVQADLSMSRRYGGSGLGLSICRRLVELMGGRIWVEAPPEGGSAFRFFLPFATWADKSDRAESPAAPPAGGGRSLRILLAEDQEINIKYARAVLTEMGHAVEVVRDGRQACERVAAGACDLVLMDVQMPGMDGESAMRLIRDREAGTGGHTPLIALTAHAMLGDRERLIAAGFDAYVSKPLEVGALAAEIDRVAR
jgi:PAS domain S-box-containing protein